MDDLRVDTIGGVGAGTMGSGIAQSFAQAGFAVRLVDGAPAMLERARASIVKSLDKFVSKRTLSRESAEEALSRIVRTASLEPLSEAQCIVEAIVEDVEAKRTLFATLDALAPPEA